MAEGAEEIALILFPFLCLVFTLILDTISLYISKITPIKVSVTIYIILFSFLATLVAFLVMGDDKADHVLDSATWISFHSHTIMLLILPVVIFEGAFKIDSHAFWHHLVTIMFLSVPVFIAATALTGIGMKWMEGGLRGGTAWTYPVCFLFGSMISATDPVAVLSLLHDVGAPHDLTLIIEGESLLNDGVAIVMYNLFKAVAMSTMPASQLAEPVDLASEVKALALGIVLTVVIGYVASLICGSMLTFTSHETIKERAIIVVAVYITFVACETLRGSGVVGLVVLGVNLDRHKEKMSEDGTRDNLQTWEFLAYWANAIVFTITGITCGKFIWQHRSSVNDLAYMFAVYLNIMVVRFVVLLPCYCLCYCVHRLPFRYIVMLWWGGLRGAVALLLAMQLQNEVFLDQYNRNRAQEYIAFCVFLSLSFQAMFAPKVVNKLKLDAVSKYRQRIMGEVTKRLRNSMYNKIDDWHSTVPYLREVNWLTYLQRAYLTNPYDPHDIIRTITDQETAVRKPDADHHDDAETDTAEMCHRVLVLLTSCFERLKKQGFLTNIAYLRISHALRQAGDFRKFNIELAANSWRPWGPLADFNQCLQNMHIRFSRQLETTAAGKCMRQWIFDDSVNKGPVWIIYQILTPLITIGHVLLVYLSTNSECSELDDYARNRENYRKLLTYEFGKSMLIVLLFIDFWLSIGHEVILRPDTLRRKMRAFWRLPGRLWHMIDLVCMLASLVYIFLRLYIVKNCFNILRGDQTSLPCHVTNVACERILYSEYIFGIRLLRLVVSAYHVLLLLVLVVEWWVGETIADSMQSIHAFVKGMERFEDMLENNQLFEYKEDLHRFKRQVLERAEQQRSLGQYLLVVFQTEYPSIRIRVKTQTMGLVSLKEMHETVTNEKRDGVLEPEEAAVLQGEIREKVINVLSLSRGVPSLSLETSLRFNPTTGYKAEFLLQKCRPKRRLVDPGDILYDEGDMPVGGAFYLLSGALALERTCSPGQYRMIHAGQFIGEISAYFNTKRRGTVTAVTACEVYEFERTSFVEAVDATHFDTSSIWLRMLSQYCYAKAIPYMQAQAKYRSYSKQQIYRMIRTEWEVLNLTDVTGSCSTSGYSTIIWVDGKVIDEERGEVIPVKNPDQPFEITCRAIRNGDVNTPLLLVVLKKGGADKSEAAHEATPLPTPVIFGNKGVPVKVRRAIPRNKRPQSVPPPKRQLDLGRRSVPPPATTSSKLPEGGKPPEYPHPTKTGRRSPRLITRAGGPQSPPKSAKLGAAAQGKTPRQGAPHVTNTTAAESSDASQSEDSASGGSSNEHEARDGR